MSLLLIISMSVFSANAIILKYTYDNSGNRISRVVNTTDSKSKTKNGTNKPEENSILANNTKVYPNPTTGILNIDILNILDNCNAYAYIYTLNGEFISKHILTQSHSVLNLSTMSSGWYMVKIEVNDNSTNWKILKI